jgi:flagellar P-ring protein precursor FlgI
MIGMQRMIQGCVGVMAALCLALPVAAQTVRIKDVASFEGVRDNMLIGYGLVVGLNGTGDSLNRAVFTRESLIGMLERLGVNARTANNEMRTKNVAAVMVTGNLPAFARQGNRVDINVSALGDASNLQGGTLLVTPLMGADGEVYAVAQGAVAISGFAARGAASSITRGVPTAGRIANGALVEREVGFELNALPTVRLSMRNPDLTTARRVSNAINAFLGQPASKMLDPTTVEIAVPASYNGGTAGLLTDIEALPITPDTVAKVVIDERNGVIVMGENVRISTVAVAQANLTIRITETPQVSQPGAFSGNNAQTVVVPRTQIEVDDQSGRRMAILPSGVTLGELVSGLNALGVGPRDMITILQTIKAAGALHAEIELI